MKNAKNKFVINIFLILLLTIGMFPANVLALDTPLPPTNVIASVTNSNQVLLTWDYINSAISYTVYREQIPSAHSNINSGSYDKIATVTTTNYVDVNPGLDTAYWYKVQANYIKGSSSLSSFAYVRTFAGTLAAQAPAGLSATNVKTRQVFLAWDNMPGATSYHVYRAASDSGPYTEIAEVTATNYLDTRPGSGSNYYYRVIAANKKSSSNYSSISISSSAAAPPRPTNLKAGGTADSKVFLIWDNMMNATSYYIYRAISYTGPYAPIAATSNTHYLDEGLLPGTAYYYKVVSGNGTDYSLFSSIAFAATVANSPPPNPDLSQPENVEISKPAVTTSKATGIGESTATLNGTVSNNGGGEITEYGYLWGTSQNPTAKKVVGESSAVPHSFTAALSGLKSGEKYYFMAYATNSAGTTYGSVLSFVTTKVQQVTTYIVSGIVKDFTGAPFSGVTVKIDGNYSVTDFNGHYCINGVRAGEHSVDASKAGYNHITNTITVRSNITYNFTFNSKLKQK